eukprot:5984039-Alexandrium_andersonii.AAC.1
MSHRCLLRAVCRDGYVLGGGAADANGPATDADGPADGWWTADAHGPAGDDRTDDGSRRAAARD